MMGINGLLDFNNFTSSYGMQRIPKVDPSTLQKEVQPEVAPQVTESPSSNVASYPESTVSRIADLDNVALTFHKDSTFDYIGSDMELGQLDIGKAISDMKKDQILQDYQYFVGPAINVQNQNVQNQIMSSTEDGTVILK